MKYWTRELAGWFLLVLGLYVFYRSATLLLDVEQTKYVEGGILTAIGFFLFRGGIQLLKIALAARICLDAEERLNQKRAKPSGMAGPARPLVSRSVSYSDTSSRRAGK
jgi:hypothetical protein